MNFTKLSLLTIVIAFIAIPISAMSKEDPAKEALQELKKTVEDLGKELETVHAKKEVLNRECNQPFWQMKYQMPDKDYKEMETLFLKCNSEYRSLYAEQRNLTSKAEKLLRALKY